MSKPMGGKKKNESKGLVNIVSDGFASAKQKAGELMYGKVEKPSPGKIADQNRSSGEKIIASLRAVDFNGLKGAPDVTEEDIKKMREATSALVTKLQNSDTIFDDISELDDILLNAADSLKTAAESGFRDQAKWCINAISAGLLMLRDNVPPQRANDRDKVIAERVKYMKNYENLIITYGKIDGNNKSIAKSEASLKKFEEEYAPMRENIQSYAKDPEKIVSVTRINANLNTPGNLTEEEQAMLVYARKAGDLATSISRLRNQLYAKIMENESQVTIAMGYRTALDNLPNLYSQDTIGDYAVLLKEINASTAKMLNDAAAVLEIEQNAASEMKMIMNGDGAQTLAQYSAESIRTIMMPDNRVSTREKLEAQLLQSQIARKNQIAMENENELRKIMLAAQNAANTNMNTNAETNINFNTDEATIENVQTVEAVNEDENVDYVYNNY